jgi:hypothetical protein
VNGYNPKDFILPGKPTFNLGNSHSDVHTFEDLAPAVICAGELLGSKEGDETEDLKGFVLDVRLRRFKDLRDGEQVSYGCIRHGDGRLKRVVSIAKVKVIKAGVFDGDDVVHWM